MLSILIPCYNCAIDALVQKLSDEIQQKQHPAEIIVCDDASEHSPNLSDILTNHSWIHLIHNEKNLGRTGTRHRLAQKAQFQSLLFLDADVLPANEDFLDHYMNHVGKNKVVYGGISYSKHKPAHHQRLRWAYGRKREAKSAKQRMGSPYVISQNLMMDKELFLSINTATVNKYGWDNVFSYQIAALNESITHIDNPVIHMGLEDAKTYLDKVIQSTNTLVWAQHRQLISAEFTQLQKRFTRFNALGLARPLRWAIRPFLPLIKWQLSSARPMIKLLDLYKFYYFSQKKYQR